MNPLHFIITRGAHAMRVAALACLLGSFAFVGCALAHHTPAPAFPMPLVAHNSATIAVEQVWATTSQGRTTISGYVYKQPGVLDTWNTHLEVDVRDHSGHVLRRQTGDFYPRDIPPAVRGIPASAAFSIDIGRLPRAAATIEISARDRPVPSPRRSSRLGAFRQERLHIPPAKRRRGRCRLAGLNRAPRSRM